MTKKVKNCEYAGCGKEFEYKSISAKYCSPYCKNKALQSAKGLGNVAQSAQISNPLLIPETTDITKYGQAIPHWLFQEKVSLIGKLQNELSTALNEIKRLDNDNRDLKHKIDLTQIKHDLEANAKPSPLSGVADAMATPEGITALMNGITALLGNRNQPQVLPVNAGQTVNDPNKQGFVDAITAAINASNDIATIGKAAFIFRNSLQPHWSAWLNATYQEIEKQAQAAAKPAA